MIGGVREENHMEGVRGGDFVIRLDAKNGENAKNGVNYIPGERLQPGARHP